VPDRKGRDRRDPWRLRDWEVRHWPDACLSCGRSTRPDREAISDGSGRNARRTRGAIHTTARAAASAHVRRGTNCGGIRDCDLSELVLELQAWEDRADGGPRRETACEGLRCPVGTDGKGNPCPARNDARIGGVPWTPDERGHDQGATDRRILQQRPSAPGAL